MARRRIVLSSSGGIAAGNPFVLLNVLAVQQASPPVVFTQRMGFVLDAEKSIVAPGVLSGVGSFIIGRNVIDTASVSQILVGDGITVSSGVADHMTVVGANIIIPSGIGANNSSITALGQNHNFSVAAGHNSFGASVIIGTGASLICSATADGDNSVVIGDGAIGTGGQAVAIGQQATTLDNQGVAIGVQANANLQCIAIGTNASGGVSHGVAIGGAGAKGGMDTVVIGWRTNGQGCTDTIILGSDVDLQPTPKSNWCQLGGASHPIHTIAWSNGQLDIVAGALVYTGGLGTVTVLAPA